MISFVFILVCVYLTCISVCAYIDHMHTWSLQSSEKQVRPSATDLQMTVSREMATDKWTHALWKAWVCLSTKPSLQTQQNILD